ncbi:MAG: hypothetical protein R3F34_17270 [Planctomycetota bacterium]
MTRARGDVKRTDEPIEADARSRGPRAPRPVRAVAVLVGEWLPVAGAVGLLVHLSWLGLRPGLVERQRLAEHRVRIDAETEGLEERLAEDVRLERALEDPIYRERLRWQWRLEDPAEAHAADGGPH